MNIVEPIRNITDIKKLTLVYDFRTFLLNSVA